MPEQTFGAPSESFKYYQVQSVVSLYTYVLFDDLLMFWIDLFSTVDLFSILFWFCSSTWMLEPCFFANPFYHE